MEKNRHIIIRIEQSRKDEWKKICSRKKITISSLIIAAVENKIQNDERKVIFDFIEKQDNIFIKIETNINQVAKRANSQKFIQPSQLALFTKQLEEISVLKRNQNKIFEEIYALLAK